MWLGPPHGGQPTQDAERAGRPILTEQATNQRILEILEEVAREVAELRAEQQHLSGEIRALAGFSG
jgi:hypothetical protein